MASILTIPRELRDEIYKWGLLDNLASSEESPGLPGHKPVEYEVVKPEAYHNEKVIRYPKHTSLPPTHSLLQTSRQLRTEVLEYVRSMGPLTYRLHVTNGAWKGRIYLSWKSVPILATRVDCIEVQLKIWTGSSSLSSRGSQNDFCDEFELFDGGLALLERFLERGVYLLSKKKRRTMTVGVVAINVDEKTDELSEKEMTEQVNHWGNFLDHWMRGAANNDDERDEEIKRKDQQFQFLSDKVERIRLSHNKVQTREWVFKEMIEKRKEERGPVQDAGQE